MREQVCTYICPWPRIQAAMLDESSLVVTYNDWRGEPRAHAGDRRKNPDTHYGDCIDCNLCVAVCPQGIDIRDGQQLECITCALCIDACDSVMDKSGRPRGLISYNTLQNYAASTPDKPVHTTLRSLVRPRTIVYTAIWSLAGLAMLFALLTRDRLDISVLHDRNPLFVQLSDGALRNGYTIKILNMEPTPRTFRLSIDQLAGATLVVAGSTDAGARIVEIPVDADVQRTVKVHVTVYPAYLTGHHTPFQIAVTEVGGGETAVYDAIFYAPEE
jgi:cytochrome c oxidase accessory protein FixG